MIPAAFPNTQSPDINFPAAASPFSFDNTLCRTLMEASPLGFFHYDESADLLTLSLPGKNDRRILRSVPDFRLNILVNSCVPRNLRFSLQEILEYYCAAPTSGNHSLCLDLYGNGAFRWYLGFLCSQANEKGGVLHVMGYLRDIEAEKINELHLQNLSIYRTALDFASLFVYEFDLPAYQPRDVAQHRNTHYYSLESYLIFESGTLIHPDDLPVFNTLTTAENLLSTYHAKQYELRAALRLKNKKDEWDWVQFTIHLSHGSENREAHGIGYIQLIQSQKQLEEKATRDAVTGLLNRATLEERIRATLRDSCEPCYFFIFDIDNFKAVNDSSGHLEGDNTLKAIADILCQHTRKSDLLGRIGGDEFVALICGLPSIAAAAQRAEDMLVAVRALKRPAQWQGAESVTLSVGMAVSAPYQSSYEALYQAADQALYRAKGLGKDRCCVAGQ